MFINAYFCGEFDHVFTDKDTEEVERMCRDLDDAHNDTTEYRLESGDVISYWRKDGVIHGNIFGHPENDIPETAIANGRVDQSYSKEVKAEASMKIEIYQINHLRDFHRVKFISLKSLEKFQGSSGVESNIYDKVFEGSVPCSNLEEVYTLFNTSYPEGHVGHSLSVSDVVKVCYNQPGLEMGFYFCDSVGFKKIAFEPTKAFSKVDESRSSLSDVINEANTIKGTRPSVEKADTRNKVTDAQIDL